MTQILQKRPAALTIQAGSLAKQLIEKEGLQAHHVDMIPGAAGGPKGIGLMGLDQAIFGEFLPQAKQRRFLIGSSVGAWRFAGIVAQGEKLGPEKLAELYINLPFKKGMKIADIEKISRDMLHGILGDQTQRLVDHPDYHLTIIAAKAEHLFQSDHKFALYSSLLGIIGSNAISRDHLNKFMQRVICQPTDFPQFKIQDDAFKTHYINFNTDNVADWLMASGSIPAVTPAVKNIADAPKGAYRDGGLIDYHIDLPFESKGIVLYPHFTDSITPGWFDKMFKSRRANPQNQARTLLISPSQDYLNSLPLGRLPDRKDFVLKGLSDAERKKLWKQTVVESQRMGDEFLELVEKQNFAEVMQGL
ncbi:MULTISPECIES: patatin-like phospholipase family protein [unclassified Acinetobacter]|uniref:patatin-like phospholipase family protein n=1 Tax=unclassified Acinetobacter TaxID=196816 RepID=UPI0025771F32|nr:MULTISPECIES: patatin-like phospholipase family protein [unclassified Acinetobacter]MDM1758949.1 patatin-like phospholipase family protein [Acinetobacter sp. 256-1]MDM1760803.1 patatin-like phospholipase family protein [Acinetobacter sp. 251-1]